MQTQQTLDALNITIPEKREETLLFFKGILSLAPKISNKECLAIVNAIREKFPRDKELLGCASLLEMSSYYFRNQYKEAIVLGNTALEIFLSIKNKEGEGAANIILGGCYRSMGDNDKALHSIQKGLVLIAEGSYYNRFLIIGYYQGAEIFFLFNKLEESLNYFYKALSLPEIDIWLKGRMLNGIGNVFLKQRKFTEAIQLMQEAYDLVKDEGNKLLNARLLSDMGSYYYEVKDFEKALEYENKSYELRKELKLKDPLITNLQHFYKIKRATGENEKAFEFLEEAYMLAKEKDLKGKLTEIYEMKVEYFEYRKEYAEALQELKKYVSTREQEMSSSFDLKINGIKAVHEVEFAKKEAEITMEKNIALSNANEKINAKNKELKLMLDELTRAKISRKAVMVTLVIGIALCLLTEAFVDPLIDGLSHNNYISLAVKALIAISLKPIDTIYEKYMIKKALKLPTTGVSQIN